MRFADLLVILTLNFMKKIVSLLAFALLVTSAGHAAHLSVYDVNAMGTFEGTASGNTPSSIGGSDEVYKDNVGGAEEGATSSFTTTYSADLLTATVHIDSGIWDLTHLAIKVANSYAYWSLTGWDPTVYGSLTVTNDKIANNNGEFQAISHVSIYGEEGVRVPDSGATLALLGLGLAVIGIIRRRK